jgi:predicted anti-sigma-YlaC factor YlaD
MSCASIEELLLDLEDLPPQERDAVHLHLTQCANCRQYFDTLSQLDVALTQQFSGVQPSALSYSRLHAVKTSRSPQSSLRAPSFLPELLDVIGIAGIVLALSLVLWKVFPIPQITNFVPIVGVVLPVCAGLVLFGIVLLGARVYAEFKS